MDPTYTPEPVTPIDLSPIGEAVGTGIGMGIGMILIAFIIAAAWIALLIWIGYTIIWRAVRRGLYEYHNPRPTRTSRNLDNRVRGPRDW